MDPSEDKDRVLAARLGERLERGMSFDEALDEVADDDEDRTLLRGLLTAREGRADPPADVTLRLWQGIEAAVAPDVRADPPDAQAPAARIIPLRWRWMAAAAVVVVASAVVWLLLSRPDAPVLVASAGDATATYTTGDSSVVTLRPNTRLYAVDATPNGVRYRLDGEAFFDVTHDERRTFQVETSQGRVTVLGTRFDVSTWGGQTLVYLDEGSVRFESLHNNQTVTLQPGQRAAIDADGAMVPPSDAPDTEYLDWMRSEMTFSQRPLRYVLAELGQQYGITLSAPDSMLSDTYTGRILLADRDFSLDQLGTTMGGRFVAGSKDTYRFQPQ